MCIMWPINFNIFWALIYFKSTFFIVFWKESNVIQQKRRKTYIESGSRLLTLIPYNAILNTQFIHLSLYNFYIFYLIYIQITENNDGINIQAEGQHVGEQRVWRPIIQEIHNYCPAVRLCPVPNRHGICTDAVRPGNSISSPCGRQVYIAEESSYFRNLQCNLNCFYGITIDRNCNTLHSTQILLYENNQLYISHIKFVW